MSKFIKSLTRRSDRFPQLCPIKKFPAVSPCDFCSQLACTVIDFLDVFEQANICSFFETPTINWGDQQRIAHIWPSLLSCQEKVQAVQKRSKLQFAKTRSAGRLWSEQMNLRLSGHSISRRFLDKHRPQIVKCVRGEIFLGCFTATGTWQLAVINSTVITG